MALKINLLMPLTMIAVFTFAQADYKTDMRKVDALIAKAQLLDKKTAADVEELRLHHHRIEEEIADAETQPSGNTKQLIKTLEAQLSSIKKQEKVAQKRRKEANEFLMDATVLSKLPLLKRGKKIADMEQKYGAVVFDSTTGEPVLTEVPSAVVIPPPVVVPDPPKPIEVPVPTNEPQQATANSDETAPVVREPEVPKKKQRNKNKNKNATPEEPQVKFAKYEASKDVMLNPPSHHCAVEFDGKDAFTGKFKKVLKSQLLFTHTEDFMRATMGNKDYITCEVQVSQVQGGFTYLNLIFKIASRDAQRTFGLLDKGSPISFKYINGKNSTFSNTKTDIGVIDPSGQFTVYKATCELAGSASKVLKENELDVIRVAWSAGFEDYEIVNMDVIQDLLKCLEAK
ncbi:MAG: hypothetical protein RLZZ628_3258 [Bacteroidota bacterium]|jgi:hypothetical protein